MIAASKWLEAIDSLDLERETEVNFWSSRKSNLQRGDYFLLTEGREEGKCSVSAIAQFDRNEELTVREAWHKFGECNGAESLKEFKEMLIDVLSLDSLHDDNTIVCTVLVNYCPFNKEEGKVPEFTIEGQGKLRARGVFISNR